jgi:hypothetical protein
MSAQSWCASLLSVRTIDTRAWQADLAMFGTADVGVRRAGLRAPARPARPNGHYSAALRPRNDSKNTPAGVAGVYLNATLGATPIPHDSFDLLKAALHQHLFARGLARLVPVKINHGRRQGRVIHNPNGGLFRDHDRWRIDIAIGHIWHHRGIDHSQAIQAMRLHADRIDHRQRVATHLARA